MASTKAARPPGSWILAPGSLLITESSCSFLRILEARLQGFHQIHHFAGRSFLRRCFAFLAFGLVLNQFLYVFRVGVTIFGGLELAAELFDQSLGQSDFVF